MYFMNTEAVPKKILELMNVPGLTRENVASHLQVGYFHIRSQNLARFQMSLNFIYFSTRLSELIRNYPETE